jgi:hypothetical protein
LFYSVLSRSIPSNPVLFYALKSRSCAMWSISIISIFIERWHRLMVILMRITLCFFVSLFLCFFLYLFIDWLIHWFIDSLIHWLID